MTSKLHLTAAALLAAGASQTICLIVHEDKTETVVIHSAKISPEQQAKADAMMKKAEEAIEKAEKRADEAMKKAQEKIDNADKQYRERYQ